MSTRTSTERSGEPAPPMGSLKPVGLLHLPVEPLMLRQAQHKSGTCDPESVGATRKAQSAPHLRKEFTMIHPSNQVSR
jgi:hypothetical protein